MKTDLGKAALLAAPAALLVLLAACHGQKTIKSDDQRTAAGVVLSGSISDAMLPYDATTSTPPLAPRKASGAGDAADEAASGADSGGEAGSGAGAAAEPAPSIAN